MIDGDDPIGKAFALVYTAMDNIPLQLSTPRRKDALK